ncbi:MAG: BON domain-containing protein [Calditrichaceae bacterium]
MKKTDQTIKKEVVDELYWDNRIDSSKIDVRVENGNVTLSGTVPTYYDLTNAVVAVWRIHDIAGVVNNLSVSYVSPPTLPSDEEIKQRAENIISWDPIVDESTLNIRVNSGILTLEGHVDAHWKLANIENKISGIRGILKITNNLTVNPKRHLTDDMVAEDVSSALKRDEMIDSHNVRVEVQDGIVRLVGTVPSWISKRAAEVDTSLTRGVIDVKNDLKVGN